MTFPLPRYRTPLAGRFPLLVALFGAVIIGAVSCRSGTGPEDANRPIRLIEQIPADQLALANPGPARTVHDVPFQTRSVVTGHFGVDPASIQTVDGELRYTTSDPKSWIDVAVDVQADDVSEVLIEIWRSAGHNRVALLWTTEVNGRVTEPTGRGGRMDVLHNDEATGTTLFSTRVDRHQHWTGKIRALRIWGGNRPDLDVVVKSIRLIHSPADTPWYAEHPGRRDGKAEVDEETRVALLARAPSRYRVTTTVPANGRLAFGHALAGVQGAEATRFTIHAEASTDETVDATPRVLFDEVLDGSVVAQQGWHDRTIALDELAGQDVDLVFETSLPNANEGGSRESPTAAYWSDPTVYAPIAVDDNAARRPNLLLVSLDTLRADHLGGYGYPHGTSPNFDRFAKENTFFTNLVSQAASTGPSHMSLFLSTFPTAHGIINHERKLPDEALTMAEIFRAEGYTTGAFTEGGYITAGIGFHQGFSSYAEVVLPLEGRGGFVDVTFPRAMQWMERHADQPFLLFVQTYQIHVPYCSGAPWDTLYANTDYNGPLGPCLGYDDIAAMNYDATGLDMAVEANRGKQPPTDADLAWVVAGYDSEIRKADAYLQQLLDTLDRLDLAEDTIVIVFSDHGEDFRDHLAIGRHARSLYEEMLHVPLAVRIPGRYARKVVHEPVAMVDWLPTLLELTDIDVESDEPMFGRNLVPLLEGRSPASDAPDYFAENYSKAIRAMVRRGDWKFIETREFESEAEMATLDDRSIEIRGLVLGDELYHLGEDPGERHNLIDDHPERAAEMRAALHAFLEEQREVSLGSDRRAVDDASSERLKMLGYDVTGEEDGAPDGNEEENPKR